MTFGKLKIPGINPTHHWANLSKLPTLKYKCGYCDSDVASDSGFESPGGGYGRLIAKIYICPSCELPTYYNNEKGQLPLSKFGSKVQHITDSSVEVLYDEARLCYSVKAFTSAVLSCRKILMNVAVEKGAPEGSNFTDYIDYFESQNLIPSESRRYIDKIRKLGNEATHKIEAKNKKDAELAIYFTEFLLKNIYEVKGKLDESQL